MGCVATQARWQGGGARIHIEGLMKWPIVRPHFSHGDLSDPAPHLVGLGPKALGGLTAIITINIAFPNLAAALVAILTTFDLLEGECIGARLGAQDIVRRSIRA